MIGRWWIVLAIAWTVCADVPEYPKDYAEYKWNDPEHNRIRKKKMAEWGEQILALDKEANFLQMQNQMKASLPKKRLEKWRNRLHERADAEEDKILREKERRRAIVSLQVGIAQSHDKHAPDVNLESVAKAYNGENILRSTKKVSGLMREVSRQHLDISDETSLLELDSKEKLLPKNPYANQDAGKCIMCLYLMEMTERDVGFPQRDFYSDVYPSYSSRNPGYPGPASYFRNFGGAVSQPPGSYNPIPGPGYSFLEQSETLKNPVNAWSNYGDYSTISSPDQNLHSRLLLEEAVDAKHDERYEEKTVPNMDTLYEHAFESQYNLRGHSRDSNSGKSSENRRKTSIDDVLNLNSGSISMLEMSEKIDDEFAVPTAFVETEFVGGAASAMGLTVCRPGKKYCRPKLKQPGRRQLERRVMMQAIKSEYATMQGMIQKSIMDTCSDMPTMFQFNCEPMLAKSEKIAKRYLHDYDDDEICTDLEFCSMKQLNVPQEPYVLKVPIP